MTAKTESVTVDPGEFRREWHNYSRLMIGIAATCLLGFIGSIFTNAQWQARTDEKLVTYADRFVKQDQKNQTYDRQLEMLSTFNAQINGRLGVIEERTANTNDGLKRIEQKLDNDSK